METKQTNIFCQKIFVNNKNFHKIIFNYNVQNLHLKKFEMEVPVAITNELEKRISEAFCIFDHTGDKHIDVREVGTVLRFMGCAPTEQEINEIILATESEDNSGEIHLAKFMSHVSVLLMEHKMEPAAPEKILGAFRVLDIENKGYLEKEEFGRLIMEEGEPFTQEEVDEMMAVAVDPLTGKINYEFYLNQLMHAPPNSIYNCADRISNKAVVPRPSK